MAHKNNDERSSFEWVVAGFTFSFKTLLKVGILGLLLAVALAYCGARPARNLSVYGGTDEIAAGAPDLDGGISHDQIAAAFPGQDDPEGLSIANDGEQPAQEPVDESIEEDNQNDPEEAPLDDRPTDADEDIADDVLDPADLVIDLSTFGTGMFDFTVTESGDAECGYPEGEYQYPATLTLHERAVEENEADVEPPVTVALTRFGNQLSFAFGWSLPLEMTSEGEGWSSTMTVTDFDPAAGTFSATEEYRTADCDTIRVLVGAGF